MGVTDVISGVKLVGAEYDSDPN